MPRILRILNRFNLGGPTYNAAYLTRYLEPEFETLLIGGSNENTEKNSEYIVKDLGISPLIIPEMRRELSPFNDLMALKRIKNIIRDFKPDIIHTHASKAGALGRQAALAMDVPVIVHTFHGHVFDAYFSNLTSGVYKNIERFLAARTDAIIAISENQKADLTSRYKICSPEKVHVVPLGFDLSRFREDMDLKRKLFREKYQLAEDEIAIGIVGRLVPIKNHNMFLDTFKYVLDHSTQKVRAFVVGDGESMDQVKEYASSLGICYSNGNNFNPDARLTFTSWVKEMDFVNAGMDIIALTSLNEGTPVSLIEAQAAGKPIVSTRVGGIENVVIPDRTAILADRYDVETFSKGLLALTENPEMRENFSKEGWDFVKEKFHYERLVNDFRLLYRQLLQESYSNAG